MLTIFFKNEAFYLYSAAIFLTAGKETKRRTRMLEARRQTLKVIRRARTSPGRRAHGSATDAWHREYGLLVSFLQLRIPSLRVVAIGNRRMLRGWGWRGCRCRCPYPRRSTARLQQTYATCSGKHSSILYPIDFSLRDTYKVGVRPETGAFRVSGCLFVAGPLVLHGESKVRDRCERDSRG